MSDLDNLHHIFPAKAERLNAAITQAQRAIRGSAQKYQHDRAASYTDLIAPVLEAKGFIDDYHTDLKCSSRRLPYYASQYIDRWLDKSTEARRLAKEERLSIKDRLVTLRLRWELK